MNEVNPGTALTFTTEQFFGFPAKVYAKESAIDENTHTLKVRALYENPNLDALRRDVMPASTSKQEIQDAPLLFRPEPSYRKWVKIKYSYTNPAKPNQLVTVGLRTEERVQVLKGLQVGDTLHHPERCSCAPTYPLYSTA